MPFCTCIYPGGFTEKDNPIVDKSSKVLTARWQLRMWVLKGLDNIKDISSVIIIYYGNIFKIHLDGYHNILWEYIFKINVDGYQSRLVMYTIWNKQHFECEVNND